MFGSSQQPMPAIVSGRTAGAGVEDACCLALVPAFLVGFACTVFVWSRPVFALEPLRGSRD